MRRLRRALARWLVRTFVVPGPVHDHPPPPTWTETLAQATRQVPRP